MPPPEAWNRNVKTQRSVPHTEAEVCLNCWYFVDSTGIVLRLAAKAYALAGTDEEKLSALKALSGADHLTAVMGKVPQRYVFTADGNQLRGAVSASLVEMDPIPVFDDLFLKVSENLPELIRSVDDSYEKFQMELTEPFLWVLTPVFESPDGTLIARIS